MKYLSTAMSTDWPEKTPWQAKLIKTIFFFIPVANPGYESKMHLVNRWLIEFIEEDGELVPWREIGLDINNNPVLGGPDKKNYGFWLDTNMKYEDFNGRCIEKEEFEAFWSKSGIKEIEI